MTHGVKVTAMHHSPHPVLLVHCLHQFKDRELRVYCMDVGDRVLGRLAC